MKKKFLNTKNVVIGLVSLVLIGASATGVTIFLKDRGEAAAAEQKQVQNLPATGREENNNQTDENTTIDKDKGIVTLIWDFSSYSSITNLKAFMFRDLESVVPLIHPGSLNIN